LLALRDLAFAARQRNFAKRVAVTGSVGKTTAKEMLRVALGAIGRVHASDKSYNNHWGVPLTLARLPIDADFGVFEIGMNHAGEITPLTSLVAPHVAIVTTIGDAHMEFFGSRARIAEAKAEIFSGLTRGGTAVLPRDVEEFDILEKFARAANARIVTFGEHPRSDFRLVEAQSDGAVQAIRAEASGASLSFALGAPGRHNAVNALAVIAAVEAIGAPRERAAASLARFGAGDGRGKQTRLSLPGGRRVVLVDESYNANPTSMRAALSLLGELRPERGGARVAVLGDMLELGPSGPAMHAGLSDALVASAVSRLYVAGSLMRALFDVAPAGMRAAAADGAAALAWTVVAELKDGDIVMVKGSNGSRVSVIAAAIRAAGAEV
jgi:UDP-N-acetylmuramoyl-tripeptide--D-alanyl-D-alanine ligase